MTKLLIFTSFVFFSGCVLGSKIENKIQSAANISYPDAWWVEIPASEIKDWEIAPQSVNRKNNEVVLSKRTELGIFSNLTEAHFEFEGNRYASIEGLWQGMKYPENENDERWKTASGEKVKWPFTREQVYLMSGFEAKKAGDAANALMKQLGIRWITYKGNKIDYTGEDTLAHYHIIYQASRAKVLQNPKIKELLLSTGDLKFFPDHKQKPDAPPAYLYHEIYMKIRTELVNP